MKLRSLSFLKFTSCFFMIAIFSFSLFVSLCEAQITVTGDVNPSSVVNPTWNIGGPLAVGEIGIGNLDIDAGGIVQSDGATIGEEVGSVGVATVTGPESQWNTNSDFLVVGSSGTGTLNVEAAGEVLASGMAIGLGSGSVGEINVTGVGSLLDVTSGSSSIGRSGDGTLNIEDGGVVSGFNGTIGFSLNSGTVTVSGNGSEWNVADEIRIGGGNGGNGLLNVDAGGYVNSAGGTITGIANVTGTGSRWESESMTVSTNNTNGTLNIGTGGVVSVTGAAFIGNFGEGSRGTARISGAGSRWEISEFLTIGNNEAEGELVIEDGGVVTTNDRFARISTGGSATVSGDDSFWDVTGLLAVGTLGVNTDSRLNINTGGVVSSSRGSVGEGDIATLIGAGSRWNVADELFIRGTLNIEDGGCVEVGGIIENGAINVGTINLRGGTLQSQSLDGPQLNVTGGTVAISNFVGDLTQTDGIVDIENVDGNFIQEGGLLAPGNSPGTTTVTGNYNLNNGSIEIELAGTNQGILFDFIKVNGLALIDATSTSLEIVFLDGFENTVAAADTFTILNAGNGLSGVFSGFSDGSRIQTVDGLGSFQINYLSNSVILSNFVTSSLDILLGDVDLNGTVNFIDIAPLIAILSNGDFLAEADCDESGEVNFLDIAPFIAILSGS